MNAIVVFVVSALMQPTTSSGDVAGLYGRGRGIDQFMATVMTQRELWVKNLSQAGAAPNVVNRLKRVSKGLRLLVVAEDWCLDSANTVPFIAALAALADVDLRIVHRTEGDWLMKRHPAADGRAVTPTVVLLRNGRDVGAWVERSAVLQKLFRSIVTNPDNAQRFGQRQSWYDADHGRTTLSEFVELAEQTALRSRP
jgi:hypothetical protein